MQLGLDHRRTDQVFEGIRPSILILFQAIPNVRRTRGFYKFWWFENPKIIRRLRPSNRCFASFSPSACLKRIVWAVTLRHTRRDTLHQRLNNWSTTRNRSKRWPNSMRSTLTKRQLSSSWLNRRSAAQLVSLRCKAKQLKMPMNWPSSSANGVVGWRSNANQKPRMSRCELPAVSRCRHCYLRYLMS